MGDNETGADVLRRQLTRALEGLGQSIPATLLEDLHGSLKRETSPLAPVLYRYHLPPVVEEIVTLRSERYQALVVSGLHGPIDRDPGLSVVLVYLPLMGWEIREALGARRAGGTVPGWAEGSSPALLRSLFDEYLSLESELDQDMHLFTPVMAGPKEAVRGDKRRSVMRDAMIRICREVGMKVFYTDSGILPTDVPEACISPAVLKWYDECLERVEEALEEQPGYSKYLYEKAGLLMARGRMDEALECLEDAIEAEPRIPSYWFALAEALSLSGLEDEATTAEEKGLEVQRKIGLPPSRADVYTFLNPFAYDVEDLRPSGPEAGDRVMGPSSISVRCRRCGYDFLYRVKGGLYMCNRCGTENRVEDAG